MERDLIHRDVKSANVLLDRGNVARIGDFGIARHVGSSGGGAPHTKVVMTQHASGTFLYMSPEAMQGILTTKMDSFAFGLVMVETLTGLPVNKPTADCENLIELFEEEMESYTGLQVHLDKAAGSWEAHTARGSASHIAKLHGMAERCLEYQKKKRCQISDLIEELEALRATAESGPSRNIPTQYICPITQEIMHDPVTTIDGHAYEREAITRWLANANTSPVTNQRLARKDLASAVALRQLIEDYIAEHPSSVHCI
jgi:serine/threonine protein kinase